MGKEKERGEPMKLAAAVLTILSALFLGACRQETTTTTSSTSAATTESTASALTPEQLGQLGAAIEKSPDSAQQLLSDRGLDEQTFEQEIRKVSSDPEQSRRYRDAYTKSKS